MARLFKNNMGEGKKELQTFCKPADDRLQTEPSPASSFVFGWMPKSPTIFTSDERESKGKASLMLKDSTPN